MSEREKLITIANVIDECYVTAVYEKVMSYLAEMSECKRIFEECENDDDEPMPLDDYVTQLKTKWSDKDDVDRVQDNH